MTAIELIGRAYGQMSEAEQIGHCLALKIADGGDRFVLQPEANALYCLDRCSGFLVPIDDDTQFERWLAGRNIHVSKQTLQALRKFGRAAAEISDLHRIGWYDDATNTAYAYNQGGRIYKITVGGIECAANGADGIYFVQEPNSVPFDLADMGAAEGALDKFVADTVSPAVGLLSKSQARQLLVAWICSQYLSPLRLPVLLLHGKPGSGKTALMRMISLLMIGNSSTVVRHQSDFGLLDLALTSCGLMTLDNARWDHWLEQRLDAVIGRDQILMKVGGKSSGIRQVPVDCRLIMTCRVLPDSGMPLFARFLPIELMPDNRRIPEGHLLSRVRSMRDLLMTSVLLHIRKILVSHAEAASAGYTGPYLNGDFADTAIRLYGNSLAPAFERLAMAGDNAMAAADDELLKALIAWVDNNQGRAVTPPELKEELIETAAASGYTLEVGNRFGHTLNRILKGISHFLDISKRESRGRYQEYTFWLKPASRDNNSK